MPSPPTGRPGAPRFSRRRAIGLAVAGVVLGGAYASWRELGKFPADTTPQGAYLRIAASLGDNDPRACFAYLEEQAQHACYSIRDYRKRASDRITTAYPEPERTRLLDAYRAHATAADGADVWADLAVRLGWVARLRRDLSGVGKVEVSGERATIETARGTRYAFRKRANGIWALSIFTADLVAEAERAARDAEVVEKAAADYERGK